MGSKLDDFEQEMLGLHSVGFEQMKTELRKAHDEMTGYSRLKHLAWNPVDTRLVPIPFVPFLRLETVLLQANFCNISDKSNVTLSKRATRYTFVFNWSLMKWLARLHSPVKT